ncbi:DUF4181 domain-containing protein [Peribacillus loiseleuriae]|uniref:DUF4181 domain-containing protein n=1 Tax=Peribacillus loiseleuriae TaxID=1679170 RepID=A0A0K9GSJ1_9BACI|nr:hypothetical protein AC625_08635 [Peribacillus loiseleuriae]
MAVFILGIVFDKVIRKIFNIKKEKGRSYTHANKIHKRGEWIIVILFIIVLFYRLSVASIELVPALFTYFFILFAFRAFMEWKYQRETRKHILSVSSLILLVISGFCLYAFNII